MSQDILVSEEIFRQTSSALKAWKWGIETNTGQNTSSIAETKTSRRKNDSQREENLTKIINNRLTKLKSGFIDPS